MPERGAAVSGAIAERVGEKLEADRLDKITNAVRPDFSRVKR
jgi:hypothetical protein